MPLFMMLNNLDSHTLSFSGRIMRTLISALWIVMSSEFGGLGMFRWDPTCTFQRWRQKTTIFLIAMSQLGFSTYFISFHRIHRDFTWLDFFNGDQWGYHELMIHRPQLYDDPWRMEQQRSPTSSGQTLVEQRFTQKKSLLKMASCNFRLVLVPYELFRPSKICCQCGSSIKWPHDDPAMVKRWFARSKFSRLEILCLFIMKWNKPNAINNPEHQLTWVVWFNYPQMIGLLFLGLPHYYQYILWYIISIVIILLCMYDPSTIIYYYSCMVYFGLRCRKIKHDSSNFHPPQVWLHEFLRRAECRADDPQEAREFCERLRRVMLLFEILRPPPKKSFLTR